MKVTKDFENKSFWIYQEELEPGDLKELTKYGVAELDGNSYYFIGNNIAKLLVS